MREVDGGCQVHVQLPYLPYFFDQTPRLLFISLLVLCGYYLRVAFISLESLETLTMAG